MPTKALVNMKSRILLFFFLPLALEAFGDEPLDPIMLSHSGDIVIGTGVGGHKAPVHPSLCPIQLFADWDEMVLQVVGISDSDVVSYVIRNSDDDVVLFGNLSQPTPSIDISSLIAGTYYIEITFNGINYIGQIEIEDNQY